MAKVLLPLLLMAVTEVLPDAVVAGAGEDRELEAVSLSATSPSEDIKQTPPLPPSKSAGEKEEEERSAAAVRQRLVNPYVFIEAASDDDEDGQRSGRYTQVHKSNLYFVVISTMMNDFVLKYSRESSDYIYGPGDIGGGNPIVFPDQEDIDLEDEYEVVRQGRMTNP